jgi:hypothetical protein
MMADEIEKKIKKIYNLIKKILIIKGQNYKKKKKKSENLGDKDTTLNEGINFLKVQEIVVINVKRR